MENIENYQNNTKMGDSEKKDMGICVSFRKVQPINEPNTQQMLDIIHGKRVMNLYRYFDIKNVNISEKNDIFK